MVQYKVGRGQSVQVFPAVTSQLRSIAFSGQRCYLALGHICHV